MNSLISWFRFGFLLCLGLLAQAAFAGPRIDHWMAPSGARVYFVENHDLPIIDVEIDFAAGSAYDPAGKQGLASLTHTLLDLGVAGMDETLLASRLADLGALLSGDTDLDRASLTLRTLSQADKREPAFVLLRAVLTTPQFPQDVLGREKARAVAGLKEALTRPDTIASRAFWEAMYPAHPYGGRATPESVNGLQRSDLIDFHRRYYTARRASVAIVGDLSRAQAEALAQDLTAALPVDAGGAALALPSTPSASAERRVAHPAAQAHVLVGLPALKRGDPDLFPLVVGNYSLGGGGFVSRLMKEVRDKRGYAYSVYSYFQPLAMPGPFQIGLQTRKEQAEEALKLTREVLAGFLAEGPTEAELQAAKQNIIGSFPLRLDSNRKILDHVAVIGFYGLPLDYLDTYADNVRKVTVDDVKAAFSRHVKLESMATVVVGPEPR